MRAYEVLTEGFRYVGNCTDRHTSDKLQDMMDKAREVTYGTFTKAVGLDNVRSIFADYSWGYQRGDMRMKNDPYVRYFRSTYDNKLCYYVRHSGIEYIFTEDPDFDPATDENDVAPMRITGNKFSIMGDGALIQGNVGRATYWGTKSPTGLEVHQSNAASPKAATALLRLVRQSKLEMVMMDDEETPANELMADLRKIA